MAHIMIFIVIGIAGYAVLLAISAFESYSVYTRMRESALWQTKRLQVEALTSQSNTESQYFWVPTLVLDILFFTNHWGYHTPYMWYEFFSKVLSVGRETTLIGISKASISETTNLERGILTLEMDRVTRSYIVYVDKSLPLITNDRTLVLAEVGEQKEIHYLCVRRSDGCVVRYQPLP